MPRSEISTPPLRKDSARLTREHSGASASPDTAGEQLRASHHLLRELHAVQTELLRGGARQELFDRLLALLLEVTGGEGGLIAEALPTRAGEHSVRLWACSGLPGTAPGALDSLLGSVLATGQPALSQALSFLGLPVREGEALVGVVGFTLRPGGEEAGLQELLAPLLTTCGCLLRSQRTAQWSGGTGESLERVANAERLWLALESVEDGLWDWNLATDELFVSHRGLEMLGYLEHQGVFTGASWASFCHPDDVPEGGRRMLAHQQGLCPLYEFEHRMRHKDGRWLWVLSRAKVVAWDAKGGPARVVGTLVDITARKSSEDRLRALVKALPDMLFRVSADGTIIDFSTSDPGDLAVPPESVIGCNLRQLPPPFSDIFVHVERALREGTLVIFEYELETLRGPQWFEARVVRCGADEAVCIIRNITERKHNEARLRQQEEELRRHRDQLEELVEQRTRKLRQATRELEERQAMLVQSERLASLGQMAAGITHEINNPVSYVMSNLGTLEQYMDSLLPVLRLQRELLALRDVTLPEPLEEVLEGLRQEWRQREVEYILGDLPELLRESQEGTRRIKEIIQSLRMFAREDSGVLEPVDVNAELESTLKLVWNELKYKCEVVRDLGPLPPVRGHATQLSQVFTNLLVNAAQAIATKGEVRVLTRHEGDEVVVAISDTGQGMTPETLSKLFTPFFTTKPRGQGTGLGLSISYGIITRHKGRIEVRSEPGQGSTFTLRLPVARG